MKRAAHPRSCRRSFQLAASNYTLLSLPYDRVYMEILGLIKFAIQHDLPAVLLLGRGL